MKDCPTCEHQQPGGEACEWCGARLVEAGQLAAPEALADLERTEHAGGREQVQVQPLEALETGRAPTLAAGRSPPERMAELEDTGLPDAGAVPVEPLAGMDSGRHAAPDGPATAVASGPLVCRYCHHVQPPAAGLVCEGCGMRLPRPFPRPGKPLEEGAEACPRCRTPTRPGRACALCQGMLRVEG